MNGRTATAIADLLHADRAMIELYDAAVSKLDPEHAASLESAMEDHRRHERALDDACAEAEMQIVDVSDDLKTLLDEHARIVQSATHDGDVLEALLLAERLNSLLYETAQREDLPEELDEIIADHHADERLHASLITERGSSISPQSAIPDAACMPTGFTDDRNPDDFEGG